MRHHRPVGITRIQVSDVCGVLRNPLRPAVRTGRSPYGQRILTL